MAWPGKPSADGLFFFLCLVHYLKPDKIVPMFSFALLRRLILEAGWNLFLEAALPFFINVWQLVSRIRFPGTAVIKGYLAGHR